MSTTPFWKKIHQTVSGYSPNITDDIVSDILDLSKNELVNGLLSYKAYTKENFDAWTKSANIGEDKHDFIQEICEEFNLEAKVAYPVMCNYLMFEYYGKIKEFWQMTKTGSNTVRLKENIWNFYTAERMFLLKTIRHIFENINDQNYKFSAQYNQFLESIKVSDLQKNLIKQYEILLDEINYKTFSEERKYLENWVCRIHREQMEVLMILMLTSTHQKFTFAQINQILRLILLNANKIRPSYALFSRLSYSLDVEQLEATELASFLIILNTIWDIDLKAFFAESATVDFDADLLDTANSPASQIVIFIWLIFKTKHVNIGNSENRIFQILKNKPFENLYSFITNEIFQNCRFGEISVRATHKLVDEICLIFADRKQLYQEDGVISLAIEFLKYSDLTQLMLKTRGGLDSVLEIAIETFPYDFHSFSLVAKALLAQESEYKSTMHLLNNMPSFLSDMTWSTAQDEIYVLKSDQPAFPDSDLIIFPARTVVKSYGIFDKNLVQYKGTYSYFLHLEYLLNLLIDKGLHDHGYDETILQKVCTGYAVVLQGVRYCVDMDLNVIGLQSIIEKLDKILMNLDGPLLCPELVRIYFDLHNCLMVYRKTNIFETCPDVIWTVFVPKIKPQLAGLDVRQYLFNQHIFDQSIYIKLFELEQFQDDHPVMLSYIATLQNAIKINLYFRNMQLSGLAYILNFVFMQHLSWNYKNEQQKMEITMGCLNIFHFILQKERQELNDKEQRVFDLCHHAFMTNPYIIETFLRLFVVENDHLIFLMERESNWQKGPSLQIFTRFRLQLALLLIIMNHRKEIDKSIFDDKLPFVVKPVASYFTNSYNSLIAELACRFLEKMAVNSKNPLLALLEMDHYQVQSLFLERLRDPVEDDKVKLAVIDLINTCIATQNGMTAAFFNLKCFMYWDGNETDSIGGDTVCNFMVDYLQNIKKSHDFFKNPLQLGILKLLNNLWLNHRENLIEDISKLKNFWPVMIDPLFCQYMQETEVYTVILRIINLEINLNVDNVDKNLIETVTKFLTDKKQLKKWLNFMLLTISESSNVNLELLNAWTEFLILAKKVMPNSFTDQARVDIVIACLEGFNVPLTKSDNAEIALQWAQLYLILINSWSVHEKHEFDILDRLCRFLHSATAFSRLFEPKVRELIFLIINKTLLDFKNFFETNTDSLINFLSPVGILIDMESNFVLADQWDVESIRPWVVVIFIGNALLDLENVEELGTWFYYREFLRKIMNSIGIMTRNDKTLTFAKMAIHLLIAYAKSPLRDDFFDVDLFTFFRSIRPTKLTITIGEALMAGLPIALKEWWLVLSSLIRLNRVLLHYLDSRAVKICMSFLSLHDLTLAKIISLNQNTVDMTALNLVCEAMKFVYNLLRAEPKWYVEASSFAPVWDALKCSINACVLSILGSKKINFYSKSYEKRLEIVSSPPAELQAAVSNKLVEIIYWASSCFKQSKPSLNKILGEIDENLPTWILNDFSVPRFELPITPDLTYGMLLCLAHYLCKALNQLSPETPVPTPKENKPISLISIKDEIHPENLAEIFEHCTSSSDEFIGFMVYLEKSEHMPIEKLSSFLHYEMSEFSACSSSAIMQLDYQNVKNALEALMCFLAGEILFTIRELDDEDSLFSYKRELCSEIQFFYEFVRKKTSELYHSTVPKSMSLPQTETDIIKRYMVAKNKDMDEVAEKNFVLVISQWLVKFCELSN